MEAAGWRFMHQLDGYLGLNGIEGLEALVEGLKCGFPESCDGQWLQIQQLCGWRVLLW